MPGNALKTWAKQSLKKGAPLLNPLYPGRTSHTRILTYHSIGERDHEMNVTCGAFADQMRWLSEHSTVITLDQAVRGEAGIAITFDDGYVDNLTNAAPVLQSFDFSATVFMVAGKAGEILAHDTDKENARLMSWDEVRALEAKGVSIGGHTLTHARLSKLNRDEQAHEIQECTRILERELGHPVGSFAYPYGSALDYTSETVACVQEAGYQYAVSNRYGSVQSDSSQWEVPRIWIDRTDTPETFARKASGGLDILALQDSFWGIRLRRVMNRILGVW